MSRASCDLALLPGVRSDPRVGGIRHIRISFDQPPALPAGQAVTMLEATCAGGGVLGPYSGPSNLQQHREGYELVLEFFPSLENGRTYKLNLSPEVSSIPGQSVMVRGLLGDVSGDGFVNAIDRSLVVAAWTGHGFTCATDVTHNGITDSTDRSIVIAAWTGGVTCAPTP